MALIKCNNCGQSISDKAFTCPHCGMSVNGNIEQPHIENAASLSGLRASPQKFGQNNNAALIIVAAVAALSLLGVGGWLWYDNAQQRAEQLALEAEQARQDSIAQAQLYEQMRQDSIALAQKKESIEVTYNGYVSVLKQFLLDSNNDEVYNGYFLFDFNQDGVPELCVDGLHPDDFEYDYQGCMFYVYTMQGSKAQRIFKQACGSPIYYQGSDYILSADECYDYYIVDKIRYDNGKIASITITEINEPYGEKHHPAISEGRISEFRMSDFESLKSQIMSFIQIN